MLTAPAQSDTMYAVIFLSVLIFSSVLATPTTPSQPKEEKKAFVKLTGQTVSGNASFTQSGDVLLITGTIEGLKPNSQHGFHIHEKGDLSSGCASTGGHFNPYHKKHGGPTDSERHVGDLGNIAANDHGVATFSISDKIASLIGDNSIIGRGVVLHSDADDLGKGGHPDSLTTGHAGSRIACGVIGTLDLGTDGPVSSASRSTALYLTSTLFFILISRLF